MSSRYVSDASTDAGHVRRRNEDAVYEDPSLGIHFVVDGMGGQAAGQEAATIAVAELRKRLERKQGTPERRIREAIALANNAIYAQAQAKPEWQGMGCVLTVTLVEDGLLHWGHVGDTRLYKVRRGEIRKLTRDHSPVGERLDAGEISEADAMSHPRRNEVYRDVGARRHNPDDAEFIDTGSESFEPDAAFLLCSDGVSDVLAKEELRRVIEECAGAPKRVTGRLLELAIETGKDNASAVYLEGEAFPRANRAPGIEDTGKWRPMEKRSRWRAPLLLLLVAASAAWLGHEAAARKAPRQLRVGPEGIATIAAALEQARPGDEVLVSPGDYREQVVLRTGVTITGAPGAALLGPANPSEPVISADHVNGATLRGFAIHPDANKWFERVVQIRDSQVFLENLDISGATIAAVEFTGSSDATLRASFVHGNSGTAIVIDNQSAPLIEHNQFTGNKRMLDWRSGQGTIRRNVFDSLEAGIPAAENTVLAPPAPPVRPTGGRL
ncbi:MAG: protein phosphatase 2C domain-containing protein [Bryobacterales bacterium]|nr:protein phosphatase 2C domain-containing protein [Bryobacterales bacterium]